MKTRKGYLIKRGKTFYAVYTIAGVKHCSTTKQTIHKEALKVLAKIMEPFLVEDRNKTLLNVKTAIERGQGRLAEIDAEKNPPLTFSQAWTAYLQATSRPDSGKRTLSDYEGYFTAFWNWIIEHHEAMKQLREVTVPIAAEYAKHLTDDGLSGGTYNKHIQCLALIFRILATPARLSGNPWNEVQRKRAVAASRRELTVEELRTVCEKAQGELRVLLAIGIYTGLRLGDACTLRWGEVDILRGIIRRIPNKTSRRNPKPVLIPIHPALRVMLAETPKATRAEYVLPEIAASYFRDSSAPSKRIQAHFAACKVTLHKPGTGFEMKPGKDGKLELKSTGKRAVLEVGFHSLRHTFVSLCRAANAPLSVVESIVGHSSPAMTRHYTHTGEAAALAAVSSLPSVTGELVKVLPPAESPRLVDADAVLAIADTLTGENWQEVKEMLTELSKR